MTTKNKNLKYIIIILLSITFLILAYIFINGVTSKNNNSSVNSDNKSENSVYSNLIESIDDNIKNNNNKNRFENVSLTSDNIGIPVLYYHSVDENAANEVTITPEKLKEQLDYINDNNYVTITMTELYDHIENNKPIPEKSILITFDDGYMNNYTEAFPMLKELNMTATIFCVGNSLDGSYYLSEEAIKEMSDYGIDIESHTVNHVHLDTMSYDEQLLELKNSKNILEKITGKEVLSLAYPFGDYNDNTIKAAKDAGYKMGFTTKLGLSDRTDDIYKLDRIYISSSYDMNTFKNLLKNTAK
ncbi:polysaccharide deacetylase family protein [Clostridium butyricum]|uniref:polysaccharide deacetylase family protein n=1 Tax=Clostridium TaxID=1485 RepID=UPI0018A9C3DB|nr:MULTISPECIES: polysaccharide deacetylase family protein [Clostridium]MCQ2015695.1 polysaccharide deacetylase family protein [Clostridium butyricum]MDB2137596.1 polysaccharide deacetylase family protein [Clostridium butyricum]MDB2158114.1 polysaccharide deacetylase family protein [Clostridium butyricum]MDU0323001.1 polysaccharide deacetylase family protein [Clostridium butyricum]MDU4588357.1 polysaccharide deacetylase family protein [Clostridium sp.]